MAKTEELYIRTKHANKGLKVTNIKKILLLATCVLKIIASRSVKKKRKTA